MNRIYFLKLVDDKSISYFNSNSDENHPIYEELLECLDYDDKYNFGFTDDDDIFIRLSEYKVDKITKVLDKYLTFTKTDVTNFVIAGQIQKEYPEVDYNTHLFNNFRLDNTTINNILDKINMYGIYSLDRIDMKILKTKTS